MREIMLGTVVIEIQGDLKKRFKKLKNSLISAGCSNLSKGKCEKLSLDPLCCSIFYLVEPNEIFVERKM
jgi:hypothetical protein